MCQRELQKIILTYNSILETQQLLNLSIGLLLVFLEQIVPDHFFGHSVVSSFCVESCQYIYHSIGLNEYFHLIDNLSISNELAIFI